MVKDVSTMGIAYNIMSDKAATQIKMQLQVSLSTFIYLLPDIIVLNGVAY